VINADDSISRPNFALQPRRADSYEASLEYYMPDNMGIVALAVFHKKISNEIYTFSSIETIDGVERNVSQPRNAEDAKVTGFEANVIVNKFSFLPGFLGNFGASGNITLLDGSITIRDNTTRRPLDRLPGQAKFLANAALFYEQGPVRARLSYAYVGPHFTSVNASNPAADRTNAATNNFDFQARIRATRQIEIIGEVRNLTNQRSLNLTGPNQDITRDVSYFGRQFWIGAAFAL
jgi:TonB-dependent receptor